MLRINLFVGCLLAIVAAMPLKDVVDPAALTSALSNLASLDQRTDSLVKLDYQNMASGKTFDHDNAPNPLFTSVDDTVLQRPTFTALSDLLAFYVSADEDTPVQQTSDYTNAVNAFLDAVIATPVMQSAQQFLVQQGLASSDAAQFKQLLNTLWFTTYARNSIPASSGFKSVFAGEAHGQDITRFSNWFRFYQLEQLGKLNYHGWFTKQNEIEIAVQFLWNSWQAMEESFLLNSTPEFEMAAYTICALSGGSCTFALESATITTTVNTMSISGVSVIDQVLVTVGGSAATTKKPSSSDPDLQTLVNNMRANDVDKPASNGYKLDWGNKVSGNKDESSNNLINNVDESIFKRPVYANLIQVFNDNVFVPDVCKDETAVAGFKKTLLQQVIYTWMNTTVFNEAMQYLQKKGISQASNMSTLKNYLFNLWCGTYSRCSGKVDGSSGFEHVFLGEWKSSEVDGQHDWTRYYLLQKANQINYHGYYSYDGQLTGTFQYTWENELKQEGGFLFGTSPAFDFSLLTVCALVHPGSNACKFTLDGYNLAVTSYTQSCSVGTCLSTAYPTN